MNQIDHMIQLAVSKLPNAYAPYSNFKVSCCLQGDNQQYYLGVNVENIAYPLCTCAEASAISQMVTDGCRRIDNVVIICGNNSLCSPCGACRQRIHEFAHDNTQVYLCNHEKVLKQISFQTLLPEAFRF